MDLLLDLGVCTGHQNLFFNHQSTHCSKGGIHFSYVFIKRDSKISISKNLKQSKSVCKGSSPYSFLGWSFCGLYETSVIWFYFCSIAESQMWFYGFGKLVGSWLLLLCLTPKENSVWNVFSNEITVKLRVTRWLFLEIAWKNFQLLLSDLW